MNLAAPDGMAWPSGLDSWPMLGSYVEVERSNTSTWGVRPVRVAEGDPSGVTIYTGGNELLQRIYRTSPPRQARLVREEGFGTMFVLLVFIKTLSAAVAGLS